MKVSDIIAEVAEVTGQCADSPVLYTAITRAVQLLANKKLVDPLVAYYDFNTSDSYFVALPRDCKTILKVNINQSPALTRSRLFEFALNTDGTQDGAEPGIAWSDRGYSPIQDERQLPGVLAYKCAVSADNGAQCLVWGLDEDGREVQEALTADSANPVAGTVVFHKITRVSRPATTRECFLWCNGTNVAAQYYADETEPNYRVIKLSANPAVVRVIYRRHVYAVTTLDDFIPMTSELAVIYAAKCVRFIAQNEDEKAAMALTFAVQCLTEEQASRDEHTTLAEQTQEPTATDTGINVRDGIIVGDVYDTACAIFGPVGRRSILDRITTAVEILGNKGQWDARLGVCDVYTPDNTAVINYADGPGSGLFVLPRYVETPIQINLCRSPLVPRNRWFEFHLNATGERDITPCRAWDDAGEVCLSRPLPLDGDTPYLTRQTFPTKLVAVPDSANDDDTEVRIYGLERLSDGRDVEVWRSGALGWLCPCEHGNFDPGDDAPEFTRVDRITKGASAGFIKLYAAEDTAAIPEVDETTAALRTTAFQAEFTLWTPTVLSGDLPPITADWAALTNLPLIFAFANEDTQSVLQIYNATTGVLIAVTEPDEFEPGDILTKTTAVGTFTIGPLPAAWFANGTALVAVTHVYSAAVPEVWSAGVEYGYWYPDELEPKYRMIRLSTDRAKRIRVMYRKRTSKFTSLLEPIPLRSRQAIEAMLRALKMQETDPVGSREHEANALRYLRDERINLGPSETGALQVDEDSMPAVQGSVF